MALQAREDLQPDAEGLAAESHRVIAHSARNRRIRRTVIYQLTKNRKSIARKGSFLTVYFFETEAKK